MPFAKDELRKSLFLYAVTDRGWLRADETLGDVLEAALGGGVTFVQLREKAMGKEEMLSEALGLAELCEGHGVPFVVDDDVEVALASGADGVHVGQGDTACVEARRVLGPDKIVGVSASTVEEAKKAEADGADYLGVGAVFPTGSKDDAEDVSLDTLREICEAVSIPVVAIGGIGAANVGELAGTGIDGVAVISAIFAAEDKEHAAAELFEALKQVV